jgi:predicted Zn-dependent peptidase
MRFSKLLLVPAFVAALGTSTIEAALDRSKKPEPGPAPAAAFPDYITKELPNGLKVFVIEDDRKPTITLRLMFRAGEALDTKPGQAEFVASLLNRGTEKRDADAFSEAVESLGASIEASASPDSLSVSTSGLVKFTDPLLELFAEAILQPAFPADQFAKEQKRTISALLAEKKSPSAMSGRLQTKVLFGKHPYGALTTPETVQSITRDDLVAFHKQWFAPNIASIAIVGDVKAADILPKIEKAFGAWTKKDVAPKAPTAVEPITGLTIHLLDRPGSVQSNVIVTHLAPPRNFPHLPEVNVINSTLGGGFSGRLFQNLREVHGYTYGSSSAFGYNVEAGYFQATAETRNEVTAPAIKEILKEMKRVRDEAIPNAELELQRQYNVGNYLLSLEQPARVAARVQDIWLYGLDPDFYKTYAKRMSEVTPEVAQTLAKKYIHPDDLAVVVVGEAKQIQPELEKLGKIIRYDSDLKVIP